MVESTNPYASPSVHDITSVHRDPSVSVARYWWATGAAVVCLLGSIVASVLANWDIETIVSSGPVLLGTALLLATVARPAQLRPLWIVSAAVSAIVVGIFLWINVAELSPAEAQQPVGWATVAAALILQLGWLPIFLVWQAQVSDGPSVSDWHQESSEVE